MPSVQVLPPQSRPPRLPASVIARPDLQDRMREAAAHGAVWLSGPAGAGKTTAVAKWLQTTRRRTLWLRLDEADSDPAVLLARLRDALQGGTPGDAQALAYGSEHRAQLGRFVRLFLRTVLAGIRKSQVLVFDNVQEVDPDISNTVLSIAMEEAPPTLTIIAISRGEPGVPFARLIAGRQLTVIGRDAMKFSVDEAAALFSKRGLRVLAEAIADCCQQLEGWAVGLVFASETMRRKGPDWASVADAADHHLDAPALLDFLTSDVFERLSPDQATVLRCTAFMPQFTATQARQLSEVADCSELLQQLHRREGFLELVADVEPHYRVHPVFRAYLQRQWSDPRLQLRPTRRAIILHSAGLAAAEGQLSTAAALLARESEHERIADLLERHAQALLRRGREHTLIDLARSVAEPVRLSLSRPWFHFWHGEALVATAPEQARDAALLAMTQFAQSPQSDSILGQILAAGTLLSLHRTLRIDVVAPEQIAARCQEHFLSCWQSIPEHLAIHAAAAYLSAISTLNRGYDIKPDVEAWLHASLGRDGPAALRLRVAAVLHEQLYTHDDLPGARVIERLGNAVAALPEARASARRLWRVAVSVGYIYQRRYSDAESHLDEAARLAEQLGDLDARCHVHAWLIIVRTRLRRAPEALPLALSQHPDFATVQPLIRANHLWAEANMHMALRQYETALARYDAAILFYLETNTNVEQGPMLWLGQSLCRLLLGRHDAALDSLQPLLASAIGGASRKRLDAFMLAIRAAIAVTRGDATARSLVVEAMTALRETDYRDVMHGAEPVLASLCSAALAMDIEADFAVMLIRHRQLEAPSDAPESWPFAVRIRCLGELEIETAGAEGSERALRKSVEILQQLVAAWPKPLAIDPMIVRLWPGDGREGAQKAFDAALHRLRKRLGHERALRLAERRLSVHPGWVHVELQSLARLLDDNKADVLTRADALLSTYRNHLLQAVDDDVVVRQRQRLWSRVQALLKQASAEADVRGQQSKAAAIREQLERLAEGLP